MRTWTVVLCGFLLVVCVPGAGAEPIAAGSSCASLVARWRSEVPPLLEPEKAYGLYLNYSKPANCTETTNENCFALSSTEARFGTEGHPVQVRVVIEPHVRPMRPSADLSAQEAHTMASIVVGRTMPALEAFSIRFKAGPCDGPKAEALVSTAADFLPYLEVSVEQTIAFEDGIRWRIRVANDGNDATKLLLLPRADSPVQWEPRNLGLVPPPFGDHVRESVKTLEFELAQAPSDGSLPAWVRGTHETARSHKTFETSLDLPLRADETLATPAPTVPLGAFAILLAVGLARRWPS